MILVPAVDIRGGRAVRLRRGDFEEETVYDDDPLAAARTWVEAGARALHVVDLDGARAGRPAAIEHLRRIAEAVPVPVQYGGGLRSRESVERALEAGAKRVILGTAALSRPELLNEAVAFHGERVTVAIDVRGGRLSVAGWTEELADDPREAIARLEERGVTRFVYTDTDRDGMLDGPDLDAVRRVADAIGGRFMYSGGIASVEDLRTLRALRLERLEGVVSGKALYERRFTVAEGQAALEA